MDRMGANFFRTVEMIVSNLAAKPLVLTLPIGAEDTFQVRPPFYTASRHQPENFSEERLKL